MGAQKNISMKILIFFICSILQVNTQFEQCFADIETPNKEFGSKTSYFTSRASKISTEMIAGCTPTYIWALIRHGTRYPNKEFIEEMNKLNTLRDEIISNHNEGRGKLCGKDIENLKKWSSDLKPNLGNELTPQGKTDQILLARTLKQAFPNLLDSSNKDSFLFQSSMTKRAKDSAIAFTNELFGTNFQSIDGSNITENENLLHANKGCPNFENEIQNNPSTHKEMELFKTSNAMKSSILDISTRLGYKQQLPYDSIKLMYEICAYETAWYLNSKPAFCAVFMPEDFEVFNYLHELDYFYQHGYGSSYSQKFGCVTIRDMMLSLDKAAKNPESTLKGTFHFSHSEMMVPTTVKLGLNHDTEPLQHDNYDEMKKRRKWRLSSFDSFAANIIAVLYKCPSTNGTRDIVSFYQNEHKITIPKCTTSPCTFENLKENFKDVFEEDKCNLKFCNEPGALKTSSASSLFLSSSVLFVICFVVLANFM